MRSMGGDKKLNRLNQCDMCNEPFNNEEKMPTILPDCGCTLCAECINEICNCEDENERRCFVCAETIRGDREAADFKINQKLMHHVTGGQGFDKSNKYNNSMKSQAYQMLGGVSCPRHPEQLITYFCKACNLAVCVDCMFDMHNGHMLTSVAEMSKLKCLLSRCRQVGEVVNR